MFDLYVISSRSSRNHLMTSFQDLLDGMIRYSEEGKKYGITVHYAEDVDSNELSKTNKVDGIFSIWGNGIAVHDKKVKIAVFLDDIHWWDESGLKTRLLLFDKVDTIFLPYYRSVMKYEVYRDFRNKFESLPWWSNDYCFTIDIPWGKRKNKILLSGACNQSYALRQRIFAANNDLTETLSHCGYSNFTHVYHGRQFLDYIATFKGMIATSATQNATQYSSSIVHALDYTLNKVYESLGCGCLAFLEKTADFDEIGLVEYKHYIPITADNFQEQFLHINYENAVNIALEGRKLVQKSHTTKDRVIKVFETLQKKWL